MTNHGFKSPLRPKQFITFRTYKMSKRKYLSLEDRVKVVTQLQAGKTYRALTAEFGVGKTQIQNVAKRKREILEEFENGNPDAKRPRRPMPYDKINDLCYEWFLDATSRLVNVSGPLLREKAMKFTKDLGFTDFKASTGWLDSFTRRNNIVFKVQSGERGAVDRNVVSDWKTKLSGICSGYAPSDIFNMDETGLFYHDSTKTTFFTKGETCAGGKRSKERITVGLCASMAGEKLPPIVIGKSRQPRCLKNVNVDQLPVRYYANANAWMTSPLMDDWLKALDRRMQREKRKILLFLDNAPSHPQIQLKNVELKFLPANTTSFCQRMDQGIIQTVKLEYCKRQLQHVLGEMDRHPTKTGPQIVKDVSVLQAVYWIDRAWKEVEAFTILKCFAIAGFSEQNLSEECVCEDNEADDASVSDAAASNNLRTMLDAEEMPLSLHRMASQLFDCDLEELINIDNAIHTCDNNMTDWEQPTDEIINRNDEEEEKEEEENEEKETADELNTASACEHIDRLKSYVQKIGDWKMFQLVSELEEHHTVMI